jgi:hypothetical protein
MSPEAEPRPATHRIEPVLTHLPRRPLDPAPMHFRIVGLHAHRALVNASTYCCIRASTPRGEMLPIRWAAFRDGVVLHADCRTLNEAKKLCRGAARETRRAVRSGDVAAPGATESAPSPRRVVRSRDPCEIGG